MLALVGVADWAFALHRSESTVFSLLQLGAFIGLNVSIWRAGGLYRSARGVAWLRFGLVAVCLVMGALILGKKLALLVGDANLELDGVVSHRTLTIYFTLVTVGGAVALRSSVDDVLDRWVRRPMLMAVAAFALAALLGALLLSLPHAAHEPISFLDNLFNAVSAVCVTGLAVNNVGQTYTVFGQAVLLALFQVGGLGIIMLSTTIMMLFGRRLGVQVEVALAESLDLQSLGQLKRQLLYVLAVVLTIEVLGAVALYVSFCSTEVASLAETERALISGEMALWSSLFHSVSAFCNAGFSILPSGLKPFAQNGWISSIIMVLVVVGGLGFPVLVAFGAHVKSLLQGRRPRRLSLIDAAVVGSIPPDDVTFNGAFTVTVDVL